jgi:signal transduction histidine kinase
MDCDVDLHGPTEAVALDMSDPGESAIDQHCLFGLADASFSAASSSVSALTEGAGQADSSLIEESWVSVRGERQCDHYLEHRLMAQEYEGLRLGRELHDSTSQLLLSLRLSVAHLQRASEKGESDEILAEISETVRQIDQEIRAFSYLHYPAELDKGGLVAALGTLARGFADRTGLKIVFKTFCDRAIANGAASIALLRVAQEALMNVHRHARAGSVRMSLVEHDGTLELSIQDDGQGLPRLGSIAVDKGVGLQGMRHRIERLGGRFAIKRLKRGTKLVASLVVGHKQHEPLPDADSRKAEYPHGTN